MNDATPTAQRLSYTSKAFRMLDVCKGFDFLKTRKAGECKVELLGRLVSLYINIEFVADVASNLVSEAMVKVITIITDTVPKKLISLV